MLYSEVMANNVTSKIRQEKNGTEICIFQHHEMFSTTNQTWNNF